LIRNFSESSRIEIGPNIEILGSKCFSNCKSLSSITFELNARLTRIESKAFSHSSLQSILIPKNVEILGSKCFSSCKSLSSITFESNSHLTRIESEAFSSSSLQSILIPQNVEILGSECFSFCRSLSSIRFESNSRLTRIESGAFSESSLQSIVIPRNVEILGSKCFYWCKSLSSITFKSNSRLARIESSAFSFSQLHSIVIPSNVRFIDGSTFDRVRKSSISIESGNDRFVIENEFLIDIVDHKLIRNFLKSSTIEIGRNIEILGSHCLFRCKLFSSIRFESNSRLTPIESFAFSKSSLKSIVIPRNVRFIDGSAFVGVTLSSIAIEPGNDRFVIENELLIDIVDHKLIRNFSKSSEIEIPSSIEILGSSCFSSCGSLSSITFESNSRLTRIESEAFYESLLQSIVIPRNVEFIDDSAFIGVSLSSISIESGNKIFVIEKDFLIDFVHHKLIRNFSKSSEIEI
jgi:hypothetical protein